MNQQERLKSSLPDGMKAKLNKKSVKEAILGVDRDLTVYLSKRYICIIRYEDAMHKSKVMVIDTVSENVVHECYIAYNLKTYAQSGYFRVSSGKIQRYLPLTVYKDILICNDDSDQSIKIIKDGKVIISPVYIGVGHYSGFNWIKLAENDRFLIFYEHYVKLDTLIIYEKRTGDYRVFTHNMIFNLNIDNSKNEIQAIVSTSNGAVTAKFENLTFRRKGD